MKQVLFLFLFLFLFNPHYSQNIRPELAQIGLNGNNIASHFFGGYDNMQLSNADLNADGREDLVIFDRESAVVSTFIWDENVGDWQFAREYRKNFPDDLRHWMLMRDYNGDGIADIFTSKYVAGSGVRIFKGVREDGDLSYEPVQFYDSAEDEFFEELYYRNQSGAFRNLVVLTADIPAIADVDFDGDLDVLAFQEDGNKVYYVKNVALEQGFPLDSLKFQLEDRCWAGIAEDFLASDIYTSEAPGLCANDLKEDPADKEPLHAFSTVNVYDVDGDEDVDVFIGDADLDKLTFLNNEKTDGIDWCNEQTLDFPETDVPVRMDAFLVPFFVNIDGDPEKEMVVSSNQFNNSKNVIPMLTYDVQNGEFVLSENDWLNLAQVDVGSKSHPALADINQDGLLDIVVGNYLNYSNGSRPSLYLYINTSSDGQLSFELQDEDWLQLSDQNELNSQFKPTFGDLDQDGDQDLLVGQVAGDLLYLENTAGADEAFDFAPPRDLYDARGSTNAEIAPQIIDLDKDGLNDIVVGNAFGTLEFIRNTGEPGNPEFSPSHPDNIPFLGNVEADPSNIYGGFSSPFFINTEGRLSCFVGNVNGEIKQFTDISASRDSWTEESSVFEGVFEGIQATLAMGDIDNDGRIEAIIGNRTGGLVFYETDFLSNSPELSQSPITDDFLIYPNPGNDFVTVEVNLVHHSSQVFELYDTNGKLIDQVELNQGKNVLKRKGWSSGVYFYVIKSELGELQRGKLIWK